MSYTVIEGIQFRGHLFGYRSAMVEMTNKPYDSSAIGQEVDLTGSAYVHVRMVPFDLELILPLIDRLEDMPHILDITVEAPSHINLTKLATTRWWKTRIQMVWSPILDEDNYQILDYEDEIVFRVSNETEVREAAETIALMKCGARSVLVPHPNQMTPSQLAQLMLKYKINEGRLALL